MEPDLTKDEINEVLDNSMDMSKSQSWRDYHKYLYQSENGLISKSESNADELYRKMDLDFDMDKLEWIKEQVDLRKEDPYRTDVQPLIHLIEDMENYKKYMSKKYGYVDKDECMPSVSVYRNALGYLQKLEE